MLPALPTGMHSASISPISSAISNDAVFCPSRRNGLTELTSAIGWRWASSRTSASAWSKLPRSAMTRAPCISACASLPVAILPSGTITAPVSPARAAYAAALAAVLPVEAQMIAGALGHALGQHQRRRALLERDHRVTGAERQPLPVARDQSHLS